MDQVLRSDPPAIGRASGEASVPSRLVLTSLFLALALVTEGALAVSWTRGAGSVTVVARAREGMRIEGKGRQISFAQDESALTFRVPLSPLETGISQRDLHLQKLLEADKYPEAILRVPRSELTLPAEQRPAEGTAEGELTLRGQTRPVRVRYLAELVPGGITKVRGSFHLDLRDYDIEAPSYLGIALTPKVEVRAELAVTGQGTRSEPVLGAREPAPSSR
ncbi:MAG TPA: YceI family protein [Myxococcales bacterium]|nr:YceI family protein [Myxococcales bacterium]